MERTLTGCCILFFFIYQAKLFSKEIINKHVNDFLSIKDRREGRSNQLEIETKLNG